MSWINKELKRRSRVPDVLELRRRVSALPSPVIARHRFDESCAEIIVKQLVLGRKVSVRALRKKRLWLF